MSFLDFVPGIGSALGGIASGIGSYFGQQSANEANATSAKQAMQFAERMSDTQYQRGVADMRKAGINPMLAYSQGGASSPSGSTSVSQNPVPDFSKVVSSAFDVMKTVADTSRIQATAGLINKQAITESMRPKLVSAQTVTESKRPGLIKEETRQTHGKANIAEAEGSALGLGFKYLSQGLGSALDIYKGLKNLKGSKIRYLPL